MTSWAAPLLMDIEVGIEEAEVEIDDITVGGDKSERFSLQERIKIVEVYVGANKSGKYFKNRWTLDCPNKQVPSINTVKRIYQRFRETGSVANILRTRPMTKRTDENIQKVKEALKKSPGKSLRKLSKDLQISHTTIERILNGGDREILKLRYSSSKNIATTAPGAPQIQISDNSAEIMASNQEQQEQSSSSHEESYNLEIVNPDDDVKQEESIEIVHQEVVHVDDMQWEGQSFQISNLPILSGIFESLSFAAEKHKSQKRKDPGGTPYVNHLIGVADILIREGGLEHIEIIQAGILHDTVEDTNTTFEELNQHFGERVAKIVEELTDDKLLPQIDRKRLQIENAPKKSYEAQVVGMADKIYNLRDLMRVAPTNWDANRVDDYFTWAEKVVTHYYPANQNLANILISIFKKHNDNKLQ